MAKTTRAWLDECEEFIAMFHAPEKPATVRYFGGAALHRRAASRLRRNFAQEKTCRCMSLAETKAQQIQGDMVYGHSLLRHLK